MFPLLHLNILIFDGFLFSYIYLSKAYLYGTVSIIVRARDFYIKVKINQATLVRLKSILPLRTIPLETFNNWQTVFPDRH